MMIYEYIGQEKGREGKERVGKRIKICSIGEPLCGGNSNDARIFRHLALPLLFYCYNYETHVWYPFISVLLCVDAYVEA